MNKAKINSPKKRSVIDFFKIYGCGISVVLIILCIAFQFVEPAPPLEFKIATADRTGVYHSIAGEYSDILARQGISLEAIETRGSVENLQLLEKGEVDVAFIQGGVGTADQYPNLEGLASLYFEPLWIFVPQNSTYKTLVELKGKRICIGKDGSGTQQIAKQVLQDNGLTGDNSTFLPMGLTEGRQKLFSGEADALFLVSGAGSASVHELLQIPQIKLFSLSRAAAYTRHHAFLSYVILPEGGISLSENLPATDTSLIAPAATLIIRKGFHPALIDQLLQASDQIHGNQSLLLSNTQFPSPDYLDFPLSKEAQRYFKNGPPFLQRYLPFWAATLIDRLKVMLLPLVALIVPIMKILPPTYRWRIRSRIYKWYDELHTIDLAWKEEDSPVDTEQCLQGLQRIENEVRQVEVPLSYARELYTLRNHIELLRKQITEYNGAGNNATMKE